MTEADNQSQLTEIIRRYGEVLSRQIKVDAIYLFGSYANGTAACKTVETVLREQDKLAAIPRPLIPCLCNRRISRYWVIVLTSMDEFTPLGA